LFRQSEYTLTRETAGPDRSWKKLCCTAHGGSVRWNPPTNYTHNRRARTQFSDRTGASWGTETAKREAERNPVDEKRSDKNRERVSSERLKHEGSGTGQEMGAAVRSPGKAWWEERKESSREHSDAVASRFSTSGFVRFTSLLCAVQTDRAAASYSLPLPRPITRTRISNGRQIRSGHLPSTKDAASMPPCRPLVAGRFRQSTYPSHRSDPSSCHARNRQSAPRIQNQRIRANMTHKEDCSPWRSARPPAGTPLPLSSLWMRSGRRWTMESARQGDQGS
jgi:hypothetical protein